MLCGCLALIPDSKIDTGEIVDISKMDVVSSKSLFWHTIQLYPLGCKMIIDGLRKLETENKLPCVIQNMEHGNYFSVPTSEDFQELNAQGFEVDKKTIKILGSQIKEVGTYQAEIRLHRDVTITMDFEVIAE